MSDSETWLAKISGATATQSERQIFAKGFTRHRKYVILYSMKRLILLIILIFISAPAFAFVDYSDNNSGGVYDHFGNMTVGSDGKTYFHNGGVTTCSDGSTYFHNGSVTVGPEGSYIHNGSVTAGPDGSYLHNGSVTVGPDGNSYFHVYH